MSDLADHHLNITQAIAEKEQTRNELFSELLGMEPEARARQSPSLFARLTQGQLLMLLGGDLSITAQHESTQPQSHDSASIGASALMAFQVAPALLSQFEHPVRSVQAFGWPCCRRLTTTTDGCVYQVQTHLTWDQAAILLDMPTANLKAANQHLATSPQLSSGTALVIWRGTGSLQH